MKRCHLAVQVGAFSLVLGFAACRSPGRPNALSTPATLRVGISVGEMAAADPQNGVRPGSRKAGSSHLTDAR